MNLHTLAFLLQKYSKRQPSNRKAFKKMRPTLLLAKQKIIIDKNNLRDNLIF